jgi:hypothetical protein
MPTQESGSSNIFPKRRFPNIDNFLGFSWFFLRIFYVESIFFPLSKILNAKMHAKMLWRRLRIVLSISLNFSKSRNLAAEKSQPLPKIKNGSFVPWYYNLLTWCFSMFWQSASFILFGSHKFIAKRPWVFFYDFCDSTSLTLMF